MSIQIRRYQPSDRDAVRAAIEQLHAHVVALDPDKRLRQTSGYADHELAELLQTVAKQHGELFVGEDNGVFVGFAAGFMTTQSKENLLSVVPTKLGVISDVFVSETTRGKGLGQKLMKHIEDHLVASGADTIWIDIVAFNHAAHTFYKKLGYHDREIGLMKHVGSS